MKNFVIVFILGVLCLRAIAADEPAEFCQAFANYQHEGTLFHYQTPREFAAKGWGKLYRDAVAKQFKGTPVDEIRLVASTVEGYKAEIDEKIALKFSLHNDSEIDVSVTVSGSCKTVHQAGYMLIDSQGRLIQSIGRGKVGGPHCFCTQAVELLKANSSVELVTSTVSDDVVEFAPSTSGKYVVIGTYAVPTEEEPERRILSQALVVEIKEK